MATLIPREPYTDPELKRLYPDTLQLEQVQVVSLVPPAIDCSDTISSSYAMVTLIIDLGYTKLILEQANGLQLAHAFGT